MKDSRMQRSKKRPRSQEGRDPRASPYSLLSSLPISESPDEKTAPSLGMSRRQQRRIERKNKRKRTRNSVSTPSFENDQARTRNRKTSVATPLQTKKENRVSPTVASITVPRKKCKSGDVHGSMNSKKPASSETIEKDKRKEMKGGNVREVTISANEDPDSLRIRRLGRLLGVRRGTHPKANAGIYDGVFDEADADLLDLVKSCDQTLKRRKVAAQSDNDENVSRSDSDESKYEFYGSTSDSSSQSVQQVRKLDRAETETGELDSSSTNCDGSQDTTPFVAKWKPKRASLSRSRSENDKSAPFSVRTLQGLLNRVSSANTTDIAKKISQLYPENMSDTKRDEVASCYAAAVLDAINQGNTMGSTNPYLRAHLEVLFTLGTTVDMTLLAKFITTVIERLRSCFASDHESMSAEPTVLKSHIFGYVIAMCVTYEIGVLSTEFMHEALMWIAEHRSETRLDAELKFLQEAGPLIRKRDPRVFVDVVNFVNGQKKSEELDENTKFAAKEASWKLIMLIDVVKDIKNNRIKAPGDTWKSVQRPITDLPFQASFTQLIDRSFTSARWWSEKRQKTFEREPDRIEGQRIEGGQDWNSHCVSKLAASLRLHTDSRRALLAAIVNSVSSSDAIQRLDQLGAFTSRNKLKDLTFIITHCCRTEQPYNRFYALLANRICQERREARFATEFSIQEAMKRVQQKQAEDKLDCRTKNLSTFLGDLWALEGLPLSMLRRVPDLEDISSEMQEFYSASFERMLAQRKAARLEPLSAFEKLGRESSVKRDLFCSSLGVFLRRYVHSRVSADLRPVVAKAIIELERTTSVQ